jgi:hypothetical protein
MINYDPIVYLIVNNKENEKKSLQEYLSLKI